MAIDFPLFLVAVVFASQILVCSFLPAWRFARFQRLISAQYPPSEYPRLYPIGPAQMRKQHNLRMAVRLMVGIVATAVLVSGLQRGVGATVLANCMWWVALAQLLPIFLFLPQQIRITRALRAMPAPAVRSADLRQWRAGDFVPSTSIASGIMASVLSIACSVYFWVQNPSVNLRLHLLCTAVSALLLARMLHVLLAPVVMARPDPYMSSDDVFRARQTRLRLLFRMAFVLGLYFAFMEMYAAHQLRFEYYYLVAGVSILVQVLSLRMTRMMQDALMRRDPAPYRADATPEN